MNNNCGRKCWGKSKMSPLINLHWPMVDRKRILKYRDLNRYHPRSMLNNDKKKKGGKVTGLPAESRDFIPSSCEFFNIFFLNNFRLNDKNDITKVRSPGSCQSYLLSCYMPPRSLHISFQAAHSPGSQLPGSERLMPTASTDNALLDLHNSS